MFLIRRPLLDKELRNFEHCVIRRFLCALHGGQWSVGSILYSVIQTPKRAAADKQSATI